MAPPDIDTIPFHTSKEYDFPLAPRSKEPRKVLDVDAKTKDNTICRDDRMIRLTGAHPFNAEAPLTTLFKAGFLTPPELFYVRNHGYCPSYSEQECLDWKIEISGMVDNPMTLTLREIMNDFEQVTIPITLVCAGNRRKEQNMVRKGSGFNWGSAGVSTSLWTGPLLRDILAKAKPQRGGKFVCFAGDDELPNGYYETCVRMSWAKSFDRAIQLAHKQNGEALRPDHGRPLRVIVPGAIGGRSVKWLTKIVVTAEPSKNWYHIYDNRVLPTQVDPTMAKEDKAWWGDERYAIYDLNIQSVIVYPAHDEVIVAEPEKTYDIQGYAYNGAGVRVGRVEVSLDSGRTWQIAMIDYPEDAYRSYEGELYGGKVDMADREACWCWCFWKLTVQSTDLAQCTGLVVRAMDENMNLQPRDMYWNIMSMLNNCWFRVAVHKEESEQTSLKFEHPTQAALIPGGWMERVKKAGGDLQAHGWGELVDSSKPDKVETSGIKMTRDGVSRQISMEEVEKHKTEGDCWFINEGEVYDATPFMKEHPGGAGSIVHVGGEDASEDFMAIHSETAKAQLQDFHIGTLIKLPDTPPTTPPESVSGDVTPRAIFLEAKKWNNVTLVEKKLLSKDSRILRFRLEHPEQQLGLPCGQHLFLKSKSRRTNDTVMRAYTPVSEQTAKGFLDVLIKVYFATEGFPSGGKMTMALEELAVGDTIQVKGPTGHFEYHGNGEYTKSGKRGSVKRFWMVSGGSGITPIYQVMRAIYQDKEDKTECLLLDSNRWEEDILCRQDLDEYATRDNIDVWHTLSGKDISPDWNHGHGLGRLNMDVMNAKFVEDGQARMLLVCGPPALESLVKDWAKRRNIADEDVLVF